MFVVLGCYAKVVDHLAVQYVAWGAQLGDVSTLHLLAGQYKNDGKRN